MTHTGRTSENPTPDTRRPTNALSTTMRDLLVVAVVGVIVLFTNLGGPRLWDRDEPRNAGCALEMRLRGDWVTPWFNDELRTHKPVLLYWLILSAYAVFGVNEFSARFWSAALGIGTALLTYALARRWFDARTGRWAGIILVTTLMFDVASRAATPDATLIFCVTLAITLYVYGQFPAHPMADPRSRTPLGHGPLRWRTAVAMYAAMGLAVLAKGPVGVILPTAIIGMFLLIVRLPARRDDGAQGTIWTRSLRWCVGAVCAFEPRHFLRTCWDLRPLTAVLVVLAVAAPWYIWVGLRTDGEFLRGFFWQHNFARAVQSFEGHRGGPWFYPVTILVGFFPWSIFAGPLVIDLARRLRQPSASHAGLLLALCWLVVWVAIFSLAKTKLPSYVTPCYPAIAVLAATFIVRWTDRAAQVDERWPLASLLTLAVVGVGLVIALPLVAQRYLPGEEWLGVVGIVPLAGALLALAWRRRHRDHEAAHAVAATAILFTTLLFAVVAQRVDRHQRNHELLAAIERFDAHAEVGSLGGLEPTWVFYGGRPIRELTLNAAAGESDQPPSPFAPKPPLDAARYLRGGPARCLIATDRELAQLQASLPEQIEVLATAPRFLKSGQLSVVALVASGKGKVESAEGKVESGQDRRVGQARAASAGPPR